MDTQRRDPESAAESTVQRAREAARDAAEAGREQLEARSGRAAAGMQDIADAVGSAASRLSELEHEGLADYANRMAAYLSDMSSKLRAKNVDEVTDDVRRLAERNPALFLLGSVALGLGLSRFAKASRERQSLDSAGRDAEWRGAADEPSGTYRRTEEGAALDSRSGPDATVGGGL